MEKNQVEYQFYKSDPKALLKKIGKDKLLESLKKMLMIRNFEIRAESAYQHGKIGGFFHAYMGQEAIQTACLDVFGPKHWWTTTYRCHALALLLGGTPNELMAELYGKVTGIAFGRGGSMHLYADRMLGGFGIVGGHVPTATGAGFTLKYQDVKDEFSLCFMGDGATVQGAIHESFNLASLWDLPCIYVIENNHWGMGTHVKRAISYQPMAEHFGAMYDMKAYTIDGMDYFNCYACFEEIKEEIAKSGRPIVIEAITERFRGHSISDPGLYRSKEDLQKSQERDPIHLLTQALGLDEETYKGLNGEQKEIVMAAMKFADESPEPNPVHLEEDVFAPEDQI